MGDGPPSWRVAVMGLDARAVGRGVRELRVRGRAAAGFVGEDVDLARQMAEEVLGGADEVVSAGERPERLR